MIPVRYQAHAATSSRLLRGGGRRTQCRQAATRLHPSQPLLSQQLRDLEDEVETKHFVRSKSGMRHTESGRTFLKEARSILAQSHELVYELTEIDNARSCSTYG